MIELVRTDSSNPDFVSLVKLLNAFMAQTDGSDHAFYSQFNKIDKIKHVIVAFESNEPVGCGAIREFSSEAMEVKRMYTSPKFRSKGVATRILNALEVWAKELSYRKCVLETSKRLPEAIALYKKNGYAIIPNYGQYVGIENSVCFEKKIYKDIVV